MHEKMYGRGSGRELWVCNGATVVYPIFALCLPESIQESRIIIYPQHDILVETDIFCL